MEEKYGMLQFETYKVLNMASGRVIRQVAGYFQGFLGTFIHQFFFNILYKKGKWQENKETGGEIEIVWRNIVMGIENKASGMIKL